MPFAWIITDNEEDHNRFVQAFKKVFAYDAAMKCPTVVYVTADDIFPYPHDEIKALENDPSPEAKNKLKALRKRLNDVAKRLNPQINTCLVTKFPLEFDNYYIKLNDVTDHIGSIGYILDPDADPKHWEGSIYDIIQRKHNQSIEDFVKSLQ